MARRPCHPTAATRCWPRRTPARKFFALLDERGKLYPFAKEHEGNTEEARSLRRGWSWNCWARAGRGA